MQENVNLSSYLLTFLYDGGSNETSLIVYCMPYSLLKKKWNIRYNMSTIQERVQRSLNLPKPALNLRD